MATLPKKMRIMMCLSEHKPYARAGVALYTLDVRASVADVHVPVHGLHARTNETTPAETDRVRAASFGTLCKAVVLRSLYVRTVDLHL